MGAAQLVVHEALDIRVSSLDNKLSLTPKTMVLTSASVEGAEMITFFAPAVRCLLANALLRKNPVDSMTTSMPNCCQGS